MDWGTFGLGVVIGMFGLLLLQLLVVALLVLSAPDYTRDRRWER